MPKINGVTIQPKNCKHHKMIPVPSGGSDINPQEYCADCGAIIIKKPIDSLLSLDDYFKEEYKDRPEKLAEIMKKAKKLGDKIRIKFDSKKLVKPGKGWALIIGNKIIETVGGCDYHHKPLYDNFFHGQPHSKIIQVLITPKK
jgi:hypothetical protein